MAEAKLDRVDLCRIGGHGNCFQASFEGSSVHPERAWHLQWDPSGNGVWCIVRPDGVVHVVTVAEKYADWPPIALLDIYAEEVGTELRPIVAYIGDRLWPRGKPSPFPTAQPT